ncbi:MAG: hypothetical protein WBB35_15735 [Saprospiraceae bacterium]
MSKISEHYSTRTIDEPAQYTTVSKRNQVKKGGFTEWREVVCESIISSAMVRQIQAALKEMGTIQEHLTMYCVFELRPL